MKHLARLFTFGFNSPLQNGVFILLSLLALGYFFHWDLVPTLNENRNLRTLSFPAKFEDISALPSRLEGNWNDNFGFRKTLIRISNLWLNAGLISNNDSVVFGRNGWLFYSKALDLENYRDTPSPHLQGTLDEWANAISKIAQTFQSMNKRLYIVFAPASHQIAFPHLPESLTPKHRISRAEILCGQLKSLENLTCISLEKTFLKHPSPETLYQKTDTHWNDQGAFLAYQVFGENLKKDSSSFQLCGETCYKKNTVTKRGGDLSTMIGKENEYQVSFEEFVLKENISKKEKPTLFVFQDSFFQTAEKFFRSDFNIADSHSEAQIHFGKGDLPKHDVLLIWMAERNLLSSPPPMEMR